MRADSAYSIGDPGRAALEVRPGPPVARIGRSDVEYSSASLPGMLILAATCRGLEHRASGAPRQDAFALSQRCAADGATELIAVICDGVGGFRRSDEAAILVSRCLARQAGHSVPWRDAFAQANRDLRRAIDGFSAATPADAEMATTAVAISVRCEAGEWAGEAAWVGDSTLWHLGQDARWTAIAGPAEAAEEDEEPFYHSSDVTPMPLAGDEYGWREFRIAGGALFLMSDGVANPLRWSHDVQDELAEWWTRPPMPSTFAAQVGFARKSHIDDRTVIGIWADEAV